MRRGRGRHAPEEGKVLVRVECLDADRHVRHVCVLLHGEVRCVGDGRQLRRPRCLEIPECIPVDAVEERVVLDLIDTETAVGGRDQSAVECARIYMRRRERPRGRRAERRQGKTESVSYTVSDQTHVRTRTF